MPSSIGLQLKWVAHKITFALRHGMLGQFSGKQAAHGGLDLLGSDGGGGGGGGVGDVVHKGIHDAHGLGGDAGVGGPASARCTRRWRCSSSWSFSSSCLPPLSAVLVTAFLGTDFAGSGSLGFQLVSRLY